ncbi:hypothetical protein HQ531_12630 [bacterium]|nr:hypothetical protein [bacterium]
MYQSYGKFASAERLIQYAIEIFDLVETVPAESTGRSISRRFVQPDASPATRYDEAQSATSCVGVAHGEKQC